MAKILIVDDDQDIVGAMIVVLQNKGYEVITAASSKEGMEKAMQDRPDLIILDVMMETTTSGLDLARDLKSSDDLSKIPILMLTAIQDKMDFEYPLPIMSQKFAEVDSYCEKPLSPEVLVTKVEELLKA